MQQIALHEALALKEPYLHGLPAKHCHPALQQFPVIHAEPEAHVIAGRQDMGPCHFAIAKVLRAQG